MYIHFCSLFQFVIFILSFSIIYSSISSSQQLNIFSLSYDVASGSEITPCNKIDKPLVVYRFTGNVMTSVTTVRT